MAPTNPALQAQERPEQEAEGGDDQPHDVPQWHRLEADRGHSRESSGVRGWLHDDPQRAGQDLQVQRPGGDAQSL